MHPIFSTLRFRTTVFHVIALGAILLIFSTALYLGYRRHLMESLDQALYSRAQGIAQNISINSRGEMEINRTLIAGSGKLSPLLFGDEYIEVRAPDGRSLARSSTLGGHSLPLDPVTLAALQQGRFVLSTIPVPQETRPLREQGDLRLLCMPLVAHGQVQMVLQFAAGTQAYETSLVRLRVAIFLVGVPIALLLGGAAGWWITGRAFLPINRIIAAARNLGAERLHERLPVPGAEDELRRLSHTLNDMLDRLERAFKSQERFVADASHELNTPLTILQGELDVLRQQPRTAEEYREFLASASEELQRISQIIQNLLLLARADSGRPLELKHAVRLDEIVLDSVERLQSFARRNQVSLAVRIEGATVTGDGAEADDKPWLNVRGEADLLASLFFNLIHNAIKHSTAGQSVHVRVEPGEPGARVAIQDFGTGIPADEQSRIFERFHRAANPTRRPVTGTGLGLAIARWIAEAHRASIRVESKPAEGSTFTVIFR